MRAQDELAPAIVEEWAKKAAAAGVSERKITEALILAGEMRSWQKANHCKKPD